MSLKREGLAFRGRFEVFNKGNKAVDNERILFLSEVIYFIFNI